MAELLELDLPELEILANKGTGNYSFWDTKPLPGKKKRHVEQPHLLLRRIQRSLTRILGRIEPPVYLHSAYRGRSYITNAAPHLYSQQSAKIDIKNFFPAADSSRVSRAFREQFQCSLDVAAVLTKLTTVLGHIPTGGNSSTMISFWAYKPMFDEIHGLSVSAGVEMTCCVDDMTFTGAKATPGLINSVRLIIRRYGLKTHKEHRFKPNSPKIITGVAVTSRGHRLPNRRRHLLHEAFGQVMAAPSVKDKVKKAESLLGRATEAEQIESRFRSDVYLATKLLRDARSELQGADG